MAYLTPVIQIISVLALLYQLWKTPRDKRQELNQEHFFSLLPRVGEVISPERVQSFLNYMTQEREGRIRSELSDRTKQFTEFPRSNPEFLKLLSDLLGHAFPQSDRFRRRNLFFALDRLRDVADAKRRPLLVHALQSQVHDEAARFLILQAVKEMDEEVLNVFVRFGIPFNTINQLPEVRDELKRRYAAVS